MLWPKAAFVAACVAIVYFRLESGYCWYVLAAVTAVAAVLRGRWEERSVALVMTAATLGGVAILTFLPGYSEAYRRAAVAGDALEAAALVAVAVRSRLWWPSWCAAFHIGAVVNHLTFSAWPAEVGVWSYVSGVYIWAWLGLIPLTLGTFDAWRAHGVATPQPRLRTGPGSTGVRLGG